MTANPWDVPEAEQNKTAQHVLTYLLTYIIVSRYLLISWRHKKLKYIKANQLSQLRVQSLQTKCVQQTFCEDLLLVVWFSRDSY